MSVIGADRTIARGRWSVWISRGLPRISFCVCAGLSVCIAGCIGSPSNPATTRPATDVNPAMATAAYWYARPAVASVTGGDYDRLWTAARQAARDRLFTIDRSDYREGVMTTDPMTSEQFFEIWRDDVVTAGDLVRSSLQTIRRTIHFAFKRDGAGRWTVTPEVLVEQFSSAGRRVSYHGAYTTLSDPGLTIGTTETDEGINLPAQYWYAIGRDHALEKKLAADIAAKLREFSR